ANRHGERLDADRRGGRLDRSRENRSIGIVRVDQESDLCRVRHQAFERLQPFAAHRKLEIGEPCGVGARTRQALDEPLTYRIGDVSEHDRYRAGRLLQGRQRRRTAGKNHVWLQADEIERITFDAISVGGGPTLIDAQIVALPPPQFLQAIDERPEELAARRAREGQEHSHPPRPFALLRARRERPRRRAAEKRDERAAFHSITSSAATSKPGGTVRPSALAVLRLTTVSNLAAACTGRSAGLSPRRMRSTYGAACRHMSTKSTP